MIRGAYDLYAPSTSIADGFSSITSFDQENHMPSVPGISPKDLDEMLGTTTQVILLDVRQPDERDFAAIDGSRAVADLFIPIGELMDRVGELDSVLRENAFVVVYCHHGMRSLMAGNWLAERGVVNVLNLKGGIDAWSEDVDASVPRY